VDVCIIIPAFNERDRIAGVVGKALEFGRVIVVDDGSSDDTAVFAKNAGAVVLRQPVNMGVGFTTKTGLDYAVKNFSPSILVTIDADGQHPVELIPRLLEKIRCGYDVVFTNRLSDRARMPYSKRLGNVVLSRLTNLVSGSRVSDTQSGFRALTMRAYESLALECDDYAFVSEMVYEVGQAGLKYVEVDIPAVYHAERGYKGATVTTGIKIFLKTLLFRFRK